MKYLIGLDYGTDSVRALVVNQNGTEVATSVYFYPRWRKGLYCEPSASLYRQHPLDYLEGLEVSIREALQQAGPEVAANVVGISVDTTGSTPVAVNEQGVPLSLTAAFAENPNAMFILWKDHTANVEAAEINDLASSWEVDFTQFVGGIYSSEWFWAKILHVLRVDPAVRAAAYSWVEHCDWISAELTGVLHPAQMRRSRCAAGHKAMWHESYDGLPSNGFLEALDPLLSGLRERLFKTTFTSDQPMGRISTHWASRLGLSPEVVIGVGAFDAHMGAIGAGIEPYSLVRVMGTSTCDMLVAPTSEVEGKLVKGICGQVDGSILPGMMGLEAGQSAFGDVYAWFQNVLSFPLKELYNEEEAGAMVEKIIPALSEKAALLPVNATDPVALDWLNGRRTPDANHRLRGAIAGLNLSHDAPAVFKALVEATAFGARSIVDRFRSEGIPVNEVVGIGGVSQKSPYVMQTLANVLNMPIKIVRSEQACALGAAICAAAAAGLYADLETAKRAMASGYHATYYPEPEKVPVYNLLYEQYRSLGEWMEQTT